MTVISDLETGINNLAIAIATEINKVNTDLGDKASLATVVKTNLVLAINEVYEMAETAAGGGATNLNDLSDVQTTGGATGHVLRHNGTQYVNVVGTDHFDAAGAAAAAQGASQPLSSELNLIAALSSSAYGRGFLTLANQAALVARIPDASTTTKGLVEIADNTEALAGASTTLALSPAGGAALINQLIGAAPADLNEWAELVSNIQASESDIAGITTSLANKLDKSTKMNSFAALTVAADTFPYATGADAWAMATISADARGMLAAADKAAMRTFLDVYSKAEIGNVTADFVATFNAALA